MLLLLNLVNDDLPQDVPVVSTSTFQSEAIWQSAGKIVLSTAAMQRSSMLNIWDLVGMGEQAYCSVVISGVLTAFLVQHGKSAGTSPLASPL